MLIIVSILATVAFASSKEGCLFDGTMYSPGDKVEIRNCLGAMTCVGNNEYVHLEQYGGVCPSAKRSNGQTGCLFDGNVYNKDNVVIIQPCLAEMKCLGHNAYSELTSLGGVCPSASKRSEADSSIGCLFDGRYYAPNEDIVVPSCLGKMKCLGNNNLGSITLLHGICPESRRNVDGQVGCLFDGIVYAKGDVIPIVGTNTRLTCQGLNIYTEQL